MAASSSSRKGKRLVARTLDELGQVLGVSSRQAATYLANGCPGSQGDYDLALIVPWVRDNVWRKKDGDAEPTRRELAEIRKLEAQTILSEAKAAQHLGRLVERGAMLSAVGQLLNTIRARLQAMPAEVSTGFAPEIRGDLQLDLEHRIAMILSEMAAWSQSHQALPPSSPTNSGATRRSSKKSGKRAKRSAPSKSRAGSTGRKRTS